MWYLTRACQTASNSGSREVKAWVASRINLHSIFRRGGGAVVALVVEDVAE
jgi:hypothetical protein